MRAFVLSIMLLVGMVAVAGEDYADTWGPAVGKPLPELRAADQTGTIRTFDNLTGDQGLLLFMNRSADW